MKFKITYGIKGTDKSAERFWTSRNKESMIKALERFNLFLIKCKRVE